MSSNIQPIAILTEIDNNNKSISNDINGVSENIIDIYNTIGVGTDLLYGNTIAESVNTIGTTIGEIDTAINTVKSEITTTRVDINNQTNYKVEIITIRTSSGGETTGYTYKYMVKVLYAGIIEVSGLLHDSNGEVTSDIIENVILSNGLLYDTTYNMAYRISGYNSSNKTISLSNTLSNKQFFVKLNDIPISATSGGFGITKVYKYTSSTKTLIEDTSSPKPSSCLNAYIPFFFNTNTYGVDQLLLFVDSLPQSCYSLPDSILCYKIDKNP